MSHHNNILYHHIILNADGTKSIIEAVSDGQLYNSPLYYTNSNIGIGRSPLDQYKFDIKANSDTLDTVFHIGDGSFGFSMGNGTTEGFIPEIIGLGSDEDDAGLYFMGKSLSPIGSDIPLVIIGGVSPIKNRPILGITSGAYDKYELLVDQTGVLHVNDVQLNNSISFSEALIIIQEQQASINTLIKRVNELQKNIPE